MRKERVELERGLRALLSKKFEVHVTTITKSLNFDYNSVMARKIRSYAVNVLGGHCYLLSKHLI